MCWYQRMSLGKKIGVFESHFHRKFLVKSESRIKYISVCVVVDSNHFILSEKILSLFSIYNVT